MSGLLLICHRQVHCRLFFLNISIGQLINEFSVDILKKNVSFVSITRQQAFRLSDYISTNYCLETSYV